MSTNRTSGLRRGARIAGLGAAAAVTIGLLSTGAANADTFVPLPDGQQNAPGAVIKRTGESALISPSLAGTGAGRVAWVSGTVTADVTGITQPGTAGPTNGVPTNGPGTNNSSTHGVSQMTTGYIVGCQVDITGLKANLGGSIDAGLAPANLLGAVDPLTAAPSGALSGSLSVPLSAGQVKFAFLQRKDIPNNGSYSIKYQDAAIDVQNCGGYAQARSYTVLEIVGNDYSKTTLYGEPFSIG